MPQLTPPPPPQAMLIGDDDNRQRLQFRLWQVMISALTIMVAVWFTTFGTLPAILAWVVAKHVLVAIFLMGLDRYPTYKDEAKSPQSCL